MDDKAKMFARRYFRAGDDVMRQLDVLRSELLDAGFADHSNAVRAVRAARLELQELARRRRAERARIRHELFGVEQV